MLVIFFMFNMLFFKWWIDCLVVKMLLFLGNYKLMKNSGVDEFGKNVFFMNLFDVMLFINVISISIIVM